VAFSPDGARLLSGGLDYSLQLWDTASGKVLRTFEGHSNMVRSVVFSPDGRFKSYSRNQLFSRIFSHLSWRLPSDFMCQQLLRVLSWKTKSSQAVTKIPRRIPTAFKILHGT